MLVPIVPRWAFPVLLLGPFKHCNECLDNRCLWVTIPLRVFINHFVIFIIVHYLSPCAIGVANPVFDLVLDEVSDAGPAIAVDTLTVKPCVIIIVRPCGLKDNAETISAVLDQIVGIGDVVHVSIPHGPFLLLGRTDVGAVARSSGPH